MHASRDRVAVHPQYHNDELTAMLQSLASLWNASRETLGLAILVCAFWALVMYAAIFYGLH